MKPSSVCCLLLVWTLLADRATAQEITSEGVPDYSAAESPLVYQLNLKVDMGDKALNVDQTRVLEYQILKRDGDQLEIQLSTAPMPGAKFLGSAYRQPHRFFRLGPLGIPNIRQTAPSTIKPDGQIVSIRFANWLCGLPIDLTTLPFPKLTSEPVWQQEAPVALGYHRQQPQHLQIVMVSPKVKRFASNPLIRSPNEPSSSELVVSASTKRTLASRTDKQIRYVESFDLQATSFDPQITITGKGMLLYSLQQHSMDSIVRAYTVTLERPKQSMTVPITLSMTRLMGKPLADYQAAKKATADRVAAIRQKQRELEDALPSLDDRKALLEMLNNGKPEQIESVSRKISENELQPDPELALQLYRSLFRLRNVPYNMKLLIKQLDPDLEKTTALLDKYSGSFDVTLTGEKIEADTQLTKKQLICYPYYSSWKIGSFYGAVDEALVLTTRERTPKWITVRRDECRFPVDSFRDPAVESVR